MFRKNIAFLCGLCCLNNVYAGAMGDATDVPLSSSVFVSAEGGWTWNKLRGVQVDILDVGQIFTTKRTDQGSARVAVGVQKEVRPHFSVLGEMGYGYYGRTNFNFHQSGLALTSPGAPDFSQLHIKSTIDGFDVLAGISYRIFTLDLFFKAGAMVENARYKPSVNLSNVSPGNIFGFISVDSSVTQVLPEIKLGGSYEIINNLSIMAAWTHVFGKNSGISAEINPNFPIGDITVKTQNPTLNVFTLGAKYALPI